MSDTTGSPFTTERELADDQQQDDGARGGSPADTPPPSNPPVDQEALDKGIDQLERVKPY